ncbi:MAG: SEC-C domain-containing protein [Chloroflexi bacterium]|nr:SEC-C domain-containing protein [Chloroflexota bacterium]
MKESFLIVLLALGAILIAAIGGGLLILLAYGLAWLLNLLLHFDLFQMTLLSLAAITIAVILILKIAAFFMPFSSLPTPVEEEEEEDLEDEGEDDEGVDYSAIPRWRRPLRQLDFSNTKPDDLCPCGSGRKYKNCHGRKPKV